MRTRALALGLSFVAACSSSEAGPTPGDASVEAAPSDASPGADAGPGSDAGTDAGPPVYPAPCPAMTPIPGAPCPTGGTGCEYGTDPRAACWIFATCDGVPDGGSATVWDDNQPQPGCSPANDARCPAAYGALTACPADPLRCDYAEGRCSCIACVRDGGASTEWGCRRWTDTGPGGTPGPAACPSPRPHLGDACASEGTTCYYDGSCTDIVLGPPMKCHEGYWRLTVDPAFACLVRTCL